MKFVPKVNTQAIKTWFVENVEKIAVFFGAMCVVLAIYFAVRQETLKEDRQANALRNNTNTARARVQEAGHAKLPVREYIDEVTAGREEVALTAYAFPAPFNSPVKEERVKRGLPTLLSIERPHATTGYGAFAIKKQFKPPRPAGAPNVLIAPPPPRKQTVRVDPNDPSAGTIDITPTVTYSPPVALHGQTASGDTAPVGFRWVCVTGMIPTAQQEEEFIAKYKKAMKVPGFDQFRDRPKYLWYYFEREEMAPDGTIIQNESAAPKDMAVQSFNAWKKGVEGWELSAQDVIPSEYLMTSNNPTFGPLTGALGPLLLKSWDSRVSHPDILAASAPAAPASGEAPAAAPADGLAGLGGADLPVGGTPDVKPAAKKVYTHKLFRFFDYNVEPEKKYRYRVSLMFDNPNYIDEKSPNSNAAAAIKYLEDASLAKERYVFSPPSEWTDWVTLPADHRLLLASLKSPGRGAAEPIVTVRAVAWDHIDGVELSKEFDMVRGDVGDWVGIKDKVVYLDPQDRLIKPLVSFDFTPRQLLLDVRGGGVNGSNGPLQVLLSDMKGNYTVRSEEQDKAEIKLLTEMQTPAQ